MLYPSFMIFLTLSCYPRLSMRCGSALSRMQGNTHTIQPGGQDVRERPPAEQFPASSCASPLCKFPLERIHSPCFQVPGPSVSSNSHKKSFSSFQVSAPSSNLCLICLLSNMCQVVRARTKHPTLVDVADQVKQGQVSFQVSAAMARRVGRLLKVDPV